MLKKMYFTSIKKSIEFHAENNVFYNNEKKDVFM